MLSKLNIAMTICILAALVAIVALMGCTRVTVSVEQMDVTIQGTAVVGE